MKGLSAEAVPFRHCGEGGAHVEGASPAPGYLLAVSGGVDSMCLAQLFCDSSLHLPFALAHCNFHLRGAESDSDEALVREWAAARGVELFVEHFDTASYAQANGLSIEMAARELRYGWFDRLCAERGFAALVVAHNANDNAETLLLNLLRGSGLRGLCGMRTAGKLPLGDSGVCLLRPLLEVPRAEIENFAASSGLRYHLDSSNADISYTRNRLRHNVLPQFEAVNPSYLRTLSQEMQSFAECADILDDYYLSQRQSMCREGEDGALVIDTKALLACPHWKYMLFRILEPYDFSFGTLEALRHLLSEGGTISGKTFEAPSALLLTSRKYMTVNKR